MLLRFKKNIFTFYDFPSELGGLPESIRRIGPSKPVLWKDPLPSDFWA